MNPHLKRSRFLLVLILLMPALFFSVYEISSLNSYEEVIQDIYKRQLDAILNSVNQFSLDLAESWAGRISSSVYYWSPDKKNEIPEVLAEAPAIKAIYITDSTGHNEFFCADPGLNSIKTDINTVLTNSRYKLDRLYKYKRAGYRKVEYLEQNILGNLSVLVFAAEMKNKNLATCVIVIDPLVFIRKNLAPKTQEISQQKFIISIIDKTSGKIIYQTERRNANSFEQLKTLWLLKNYSMEIKLKGATLRQVVQKRSEYNIVFIVLINIILIAGFWFIFRTIKKELELAQIKSDFISNVSHELRTPLALINMYAETLEMGRVRTEEKKNEYYQIISSETNRLSRIVNKILNFSKIESGKMKYHFDSIDLNDLTSQVFSTFSFNVRGKGFEFSLNKDESIPFISGDKEAISEAIINLIDNAVKYSKDEKSISVSTGEEQNMVYVEITDKGIGIDPKETKRIFEKFYRVSTGLVHNTKGTGLGLTLVRHIMEAHNGKVTLVSKPGKGSTFRLSFPKS